MSGGGTARLKFLWEASHMLLSTCPQVSSLYMSQLLSLTSDRDLSLHEDIQSRACAGCGSIFLPGVNCTVKIIPTPESSEKKERQRAAEKRKLKARSSQKSNCNMDAHLGKGTASTYSKADNSETTITSSIKTPPAGNSPASDARKKIIRIVSHNEQAQKGNQVQRLASFGDQGAAKSINKAEVRSNRLLNRVIYHCIKCERETEAPGTKKGYLEGRIKPTKSISQARKRKREASKGEPELPSSPRTPSISKPVSTHEPTPKGSNRPSVQHRGFSVSTAIGVKGSSMAGLSVSEPVSPVGGLSRASSVASSAATSPASSPKLSTLGDKSHSSGMNKKKKKNNLASLLASQKAQKDSAANSDKDSNGGDSVLANFLLGL
ncbi:hypothetical protein BGZ94_002418 [Podila epigama]|nr:hypothetical protein BGZ94_002418 [Podila epigama]